ncbi:hypothetical protein AMAG_04006 [Allomyces macrogynus ATCC 38327]|uniref:Fungal lipase-type domain-containing protein n=1 Tax=Allomyces macrogynus (strain ATCC 38327) TaxID=578462 RepID=A0A0L0S7M1_ALLM3|nr:hypothetical protein AMAG_04006 [Allomyces macrogynus ATCC 38327]|eukprot:KNE58436.1 hypothetical protein AMAG_04006 [Allomyces macrogynus ATCC 38327]
MQPGGGAGGSTLDPDPFPDPTALGARSDSPSSAAPVRKTRSRRPESIASTASDEGLLFATAPTTMNSTPVDVAMPSSSAVAAPVRAITQPPQPTGSATNASFATDHPVTSSLESIRAPVVHIAAPNQTPDSNSIRASSSILSPSSVLAPNTGPAPSANDTHLSALPSPSLVRRRSQRAQADGHKPVETLHRRRRVTATLILDAYFGQQIGPAEVQRFHRARGWRRVMHLLATLSLVGGIVLLTCILFCTGVALSYLAYQVDVKEYTAIVVCGVVFYVMVIAGLTRTFLRTAIRMVLWIWTMRQGPAVDPSLMVGESGTVPTVDANGRNITLARTLVPGRERDWVATFVFFLATPGRVIVAWGERLVEGIADLMLSVQLWWTKRSAPAHSTALDTTADETGTHEDDVANDEDHEEMREAMLNRVRIVFYILAVLLLFAVPCLVIASKYGYYAIVSVISVLYVAGSAILIIFVNAINRLFRTFSFLLVLWKNLASPERRRAMYVASSGYDTKQNIVDQLLDQALRLAAALLFLGFVFQSKLNGPYSLPGVLLLVIFVLLILRARHLLSLCCCCCCCCCRSRRKAAKSANELTSEYYDGRGWKVPIIVFLARVALVALGLSALVITDLGQVTDPGVDSATTLADLFNKSKARANDPAASTVDRQTLIVCVALYAVAYFGKEVALLVTQIPSWIASLVLAVSLIGQVTVAAVAVTQYVGLSASALVTLTYLAYDIRDGRAFWTRRGADGKPLGAVTLARRSKRKSTDHVNAMATVVLILGSIVVSVVIGYLVGSDQPGVSSASSASELVYHNATRMYPMCTMKYADRFTLVDFTTMSAAAYGESVEDALAYLRGNPNLQDAYVHFTKPNTTQGVNFWEVRFEKSPEVSVVVVRGTSTVEDIVQDAQLWSTSLILQGSSMFGTWIDLWPRPVVARLVQFVTSYVAFSNFIYSQEVERYTKALLSSGKRTVFVAGHSLGSGIAQIVGSRLEVPAIGVSGPGLGLTYLNFGTTVEAVTHWALNIVPFTDPVPMTDVQVAAVVHLPCYQSVPSKCHSVLNTLQTMINVCAGVKVSGSDRALAGENAFGSLTSAKQSRDDAEAAASSAPAGVAAGTGAGSANYFLSY